MSKLPFLFFFFSSYFFLSFSFFSPIFFFSSPPYPFRFSSGPPLELPLLLSFSPPAAPGPLAAGHLGPPPPRARAPRRRPPWAPSHRELAPPPTASGTPPPAAFSSRCGRQARGHGVSGGDDDSYRPIETGNRSAIPPGGRSTLVPVINCPACSLIYLRPALRSHLN